MCRQSGIASLRLVNDVDLVDTFEIVVDEFLEFFALFVVAN